MNGSGIDLSTSAFHAQMQKCPPMHPQVHIHSYATQKTQRKKRRRRKKKGREGGEGEKGRALAAKPDYMSLIPGPTWYKRKLTPID